MTAQQKLLKDMPTSKEVIEQLGISEATLARMRRDNRITFYYYPARVCRYPQSEIDRILREGF